MKSKFMDDSAWLGLGIGIAIGGVYAWLQLSALRKNEQRQQQAGEVQLSAMVPVVDVAAHTIIGSAGAGPGAGSGGTQDTAVLPVPGNWSGRDV